ncbi:helix-hairpin-helix domain-containing protein [Vagococcus jeotgali]|uniref:helix-hairpin-helix domain-containing protein n=1 Tax=Vagococcus jeotgali TaxID=3109030 RepID=UPI002DDAC5E7|nr:helix-hairpin-helix domain-containing protein [Vagococcus sp. B2T-5]
MWIEKIKDKFVLLIVLSIFCLVGIMMYVILPKNRTEFDSSLELVSEVSSITSDTNEEEISDKFYVDIKGAVVSPGVYEVSDDMRVLDVVKLAGGLTEASDDKKVNLAEKLIDQMVIYIPEIGEEGFELVTQVSTGDKSITEQDSKLININTSSASELQSLNGIGEKKAEKIIQFREENGSFKTIEDLKKVDGIGEKTFDSLKSQITI